MWTVSVLLFIGVVVLIALLFRATIEIRDAQDLIRSMKEMARAAADELDRESARQVDELLRFRPDVARLESENDALRKELEASSFRLDRQKERADRAESVNGRIRADRDAFRAALEEKRKPKRNKKGQFARKR